MNRRVGRLLAQGAQGARLAPRDLRTLLAAAPTDALTNAAAARRDSAYGDAVTYSRKVFVPLTRLCRDVCHYCTFARPPRRGERAYLTPEEVLEIARAGAAAGCKEALFTLGDKPELRYRVAQTELERLGYPTTVAYMEAMAALVLRETGLLPHLNPGVLTADEVRRLRSVSVSQGLMLESASARLWEKGGPHYGSPDKEPKARLATIREAGRAAVPFTSGLLIGIGESEAERLDALLALRRLHERYGHLQEVIVQNFKPKAGTRMATAPEPEPEAHERAIALARLTLDPAVAVQAPPNLGAGRLPRLVAAGINDWGGVSPVTADHVNPEAPWPEVDRLAAETAAAGKTLIERLAVYPAYLLEAPRWLAPEPASAALRLCDGGGHAREDAWVAGAEPPPPTRRPPAGARPTLDVERILDRALRGCVLDEAEIVHLFGARGADFEAVCMTADALRRRICGDEVTYVVNRNINYTNVCSYRCRFCAFSKGRLSENLRGRPYVLDLDEVARRAREAWERGATEVCMQGGIHPAYTGDTYLELCAAAKRAAPGLHVHAFTPLEVWQGARTLDLTVEDFLGRLWEAGLGSLPGTAAEVLDDEVRRVICPDKVTTGEWLRVMEAAHGLGLASTSTIMFGHVDGPVHWARHLIRLRDLQARTAGFTELVPLPFVPMEAPIYLKGRARPGPTYREAVLMHAVARLALQPHLTNIQVSWVKMGPEGAQACLRAGANDLGGTLMNETITRSAGARHGQEMPPERMEALIRGIGRRPRQRTTLYEAPPAGRVAASFGAPALSEPMVTPARDYEHAAAGAGSHRR